MANNSALGSIVRAAIHPAIGIARVGNSKTGYFIGPEVSEPSPEPVGFYRDAQGALKRQAARFRIYGYDANNNVVAELNAGNAQIGWSARLANQKAAWYQFTQALDIPESVQQNTVSARRNASVPLAQRNTLVIDGGLQTVCDINQQGPSFVGSFQGTSVYLGELRTDEDGHLLVLGGLGNSQSPSNAPLLNFANNDGWFDDTSDGPVCATVSLNGQSIPVDNAWVVVAPPNYAPNLKTLRTLHDLLTDLFNPIDPNNPPQVSFTNDILPIFKRMSGLQWVNGGFFQAFGHGKPLDFAEPGFLQQASVPLREPIDLFQETRRQIANAFRNVERDGYSPTPLPWIYGDAIDKPYPKTDNTFLALSNTQLNALQAWAQGSFLGDYDPQHQPARRIGEVPLAGQPAMLDRAALEFCLADAFHPGCEVTWPIRHASLFEPSSQSPRTGFRILQAAPNTVQPDYGDELTPQNITEANGPLQAQWPGGITRWMAIPWQTDTASCLSGYVPEYDPLLPTFWPARVPNHVLEAHEYALVADPSVPMPVRRAAFQVRRSWPGVLPGATHEDQVDAMIKLFPFMGITEQRPGPTDTPEFPRTMQVTVLPDFTQPLPLQPASAGAAAQARPRSAADHGVKPSRDGTYMGRFRPPGLGRKA